MSYGKVKAYGPWKRNKSSHDLVLSKHHKDVRLAVYERDGYACVKCGAAAVDIPDGYDGSRALPTDRKAKSGFCVVLCVDHIVSRRNGGKNVLENFQTLCESCNAAKTANDRRGVA